MLLSTVQLQNIARTIYNLMSGIYNLDEFKSPYNDLISNELDANKGKATKNFICYFDEINLLKVLFNKIDGTEKEEYDVIDNLHNAIDKVLEEITMSSICTGYLSSKNIINTDFGASPYRYYFREQIFVPQGIGNRSYNRLGKILNEINQKLSQQRETMNEGKQILDKLWEFVDLEYAIFVDIGFWHGTLLGKDKYPIWYNPDFENNLNHIPYKLQRNLTEEVIKELYNSAEEFFDPCDNFVTTKFWMKFCKCQEDLLKLCPEYREQIEKMCFYHSLSDTTEMNNTFYNGFQFGLRMAVDVFYRKKKD